MTKESSGVYTASYPNGGRGVTIVLNDHLVKQAEAGDEKAQKQICHSYKEASGYWNPVSWYTLRSLLTRVSDARQQPKLATAPKPS